MPKLSRFHTSVITETLAVLLPAHPVLDPATRRRVHGAVLAFVTSQVEALPSFLRLPYRLAITVFDVLPFVRYRRSFRRLDAHAKALYLASWDESRLAAFRNYVKLIRSCALLAYYDHPDVLRALRLREPAIRAVGS